MAATVPASITAFIGASTTAASAATKAVAAATAAPVAATRATFADLSCHHRNIYEIDT
jgi:hypothetical protein